ncbi:Methyltransferase domain-containing protein [Kibdelosporangium aridum]|uniref:Methyltransferase domain-containing protein n=1 Tax=Kibdelosporangium aridum TaxID=2030 RepID=A0A1W2F6V6_KIBAR|nr:Methyltransferase domain-containing protein [Kibdelosporangium aridum]
MPGWCVNHFGEDVAKDYDKGVKDMPVVPVVQFLRDLAGDGPALELGIGTGRIAVPLSQAGVAVHGIDLSPEMLARLHAKPGAERIGVTVGDFATAKAPGRFQLAYLVFNTISNLTTQDAQVACFANVAEHLVPGGFFVIEVGVPQLQRIPPGETARPFNISPTHLGFDEYDIANQGMISHHYHLADGAVQRRFSMPFRYVWPAELDLMARMAGMALHERFEDWDRSPFTSDSHKHISVWRKQ